MITDINAITPEYMKYRIEQETEQYKQEIERLNNIIKEVREYIKSIDNYFLSDSCMKILEILDKEKNNECKTI